MDLLLTHGYFLAEDDKEQQIRKPYPPLGLLYVSSHLRSKGFAVEVYDSTFGSLAELESLLDSHEPSALGVYGTLLTRGSVVRIVEAAKQRGWQVIVGGPEPANYAEQYLRAGADLVVEGEGERTLEELLGGSDPATTAGVHFLDASGTAQFSGPRSQIADLDSQPWPDREQINLKFYLKTWREAHGYGSLNAIASRGCPYRCRWCSHSTFGMTHRRRSAAGFADEVQHLLERYTPERLWMADDVFTIHPGWVLDYLQQARERRIIRPFECITRADRVNESMADAMAELGAYRVWVGSESGSQRILDAMQRGVKVEQVRRAVELLRERGIETGMFLMWGYEGERMEDIEATVEHLKACLPDVFFTTVAYPIKGTAYFAEIEPKLEPKRPWRDSTDRDWTVRGRHSRRFYSFADQLLQGEVKRRRLELAGESDPALDAAVLAARDGLQSAAGEVET